MTFALRGRRDGCADQSRPPPAMADRPAIGCNERRGLGPPDPRRGEAAVMSELVTSLRQGLEVFFAPGPELGEVRILKTPKKTISGYFDRLELAVEAVEEAVGLYTTNAAFYATLNSVTKAVHARAKNRLKPYADCTSVDADILRRNYLLIDCDPRRPAGRLQHRRGTCRGSGGARGGDGLAEC